MTRFQFQILRYCPPGLTLRRLNIVLLVLCLQASAQAGTLPVSLVWNSPAATGNGDRKLNFTDAVYGETQNELPAYVKTLIPSANLSARLENIVTEPIPSSETGLLPSDLPADFQLITSVVVERKQAGMRFVLVPVRKRLNGGAERLISADIVYRETPSAAKTVASQRTYASNSVLSSGKWVRVAVLADGIYKVSYDYLNSRGLEMNAPAISAVRLYGNGGGMMPLLNSASRNDDLKENAIQVVDANGDGTFNGSDYLLFYGQGPHTWTWSASEKRYNHQQSIYTDTTYYFITTDGGSGPATRLTTQSSSTLTPTRSVTTFTDHQYHEKDLTNYIKSGKNWFGEVFDAVLSQQFRFSFPNLVAGPVSLKSSVMARTSINTVFPVFSYFKINEGSNPVFLTQSLPNVSESYTADFGTTVINTGTFTASSGDINLTYTFVPYISSATGYLDYISLNATRSLIMNDNQLFFRDRDLNNTASESAYTITGVNGNGIQLWDITDPLTPKSQNFTLNNGTLGFARHVDANSGAEYVVFNESAIKQPAACAPIANQNLHGTAAADLIIITPAEFKSEAERLAQFHRDHDGLRVVVAEKYQVYNEFSGGAQDPVGIRDFAKMLYDRASTALDMPRYLLLFGDGSYDLKYRMPDNTNFLPTYQSDNSVSLTYSYTCDDFYGMLDDNEGPLNNADLLDLGVGRIPAKTTEEATQMVDKIIRYSTIDAAAQQTTNSLYGPPNLADWKNILCFIADDQDHNLHFNQSETILSTLQNDKPVYNFDKINIDAYQQVSTPGGSRYPEVNDAIDKRMEKGAFLINYTGHGGEIGWAAEAILSVDMINHWKNKWAMPAFITATCEFSRYDDPSRTSAGELVLLNPTGGGICLFTTVRLAFAIDNQYINTKLLKYMFQPLNGAMPRIGDIQRLAKKDNSSNRNVTLLGDPAVRLVYPEYKVVTTAIENSLTQTDIDTLSALSRVTIKGKVTDSNGSTLTSFNGVVYPTIYDKTSEIHTLVNDYSGNDVSDPGQFNLRKNILYKGKASVTNGLFTCSFIVPKDIAYQYGSGRISYYAHNGADDANGYDEKLTIGGASAVGLSDDKGPQIKLYMNDDKFAFGGMTNASPNIYAVLEDSSGINTVGNGIGHDITATLDGSPNKLYVLNDYYESELDNFRKGKVIYPLSSLSEGLHTLSFKAWDINNNSAEAYTEFVVSESAGLALDHVLNYPNPFTTHTSFFFEHNKAGSGMKVQIQVYTVSGKLVKTLDTYLTNEGFRNTSLEWDGKDEFGDQLAKGVYLYKLKVRTDDGETAQKMERLVILR